MAIRPPTSPARWCHPPQTLTYLSLENPTDLTQAFTD